MNTVDRPKLDPAAATSKPCPVTHRPTPANELSVPLAPSNGRRRHRILVADDSADNLFLFRTYLKPLAAEVDEASDGRSALAMFLASEYDLVLMDVHMPVMDGLIATRQMREEEARRGARRTPIVALTASVLGEEVEVCLAAGADIHLAKPVKKATLLEIVANLLEHGSPVMPSN